MKLRPTNRRLALFMGFAVVFLVALFARTFYVQVVAAPDLRTKAVEQYTRTINLDGPRGTIYDRDGSKLAVSETTATVYADPKGIKDPAKVADVLAPILEQPFSSLLQKLTEDSHFVYLARKIETAKGELIKEKDLAGIGVIAEDRRVYPTGALAPQLLGFVNTDNKGIAGLEYQYDDILKGEPGQVKVVSDNKGNRLSTTSVTPAVPGQSITLTVDQDIQFETEKVLTQVVKDFQAKRACAVVLDPSSGEVLAMADTPVFDTNSYGQIPEKDRRNSVVTDQYEPGSTFKMVVAAAALQAGLVTPSTTFRLGKEIKVYDRTIHEADTNIPDVRELSVTQILAESSNVGAVTLGLKVGKDRLVDMIKKFGFTTKLGIDFPGEATGMMPSKWSGVTIANIPIGQGISASPLQLASAYAAIANDGVLVQPHLVRDVTSPWSRRVVSERVATQLRTMLGVTVTEGTGTRAQVAGFQVAGKTGTAQKVDEVNGGYAHDRFISSFVGMVPADDPRLVILVVVDEPTTEYLGAKVAAPAFAKIADVALRILGIAPDTSGTDDAGDAGRG